MTTRIRITRAVDDDELGRQIEPHMVSLGNAVARRMQRLVPKRTWALHDTIQTGTERSAAKVVTQVGFGSAEVRYGEMVERGTSKMRAQPFARPALLQSRAADLNFEGGGPARHGVITVTTRRSRRRAS